MQLSNIVLLQKIEKKTRLWLDQIKNNFFYKTFFLSKAQKSLKLENHKNILKCIFHIFFYNSAMLTCFNN